jgi:hypothetical protein
MFEPRNKNNERWIALALGLGISGLFVAEIARDFHPVKLSAAFMALFLLPVTVLHEAGHAAVSHWLGWRVCRIVVGLGRPVLRFRIGSIPVDIRLLPISGYVLPAPEVLRRPRLESTLIYAAGPAAELLLALGALWAVGPERLFARTDSIPIIAVQSLALLVAIDLFFNLVPLSTDSENGGAYTDGLGMLVSPFLPDWHFRRAMILPWRIRAERCSRPADKIVVLEQGLEALPDNPFLRLELADALFEAHDVLGAREQRVRALESGELPAPLAQELRRLLGLG